MKLEIFLSNSKDSGSTLARNQELKFLSFDAGRSDTIISAGYFFTCALRSDSRVVCWGLNDNGELGIGSTLTVGDNPNEMGDQLVPVDLGTGLGIVI